MRYHQLFTKSHIHNDTLIQSPDIQSPDIYHLTTVKCHVILNDI